MLAARLAIGGAFHGVPEIGFPPVRDMAMLIATIAGGLAAAWLFVRWRRAEAHLRLLQRLCQLSRRELCDEQSGLAHGQHEAGSAVSLVYKTLCQQSRQLQDAEEERASLELRSLRGGVDQARLRAVLASLPDPALVVDEFGQVASANSAAEEFLGLRLDSDANQDLTRFVRCEQLLDLLVETAHRKVPVSRSTDLPGDASGSPHSYRVTARNYGRPDSDSQAGEGRRGVVAVFQNTSALSEAGRRHAEFVSAVSHEMKTPLTGIKAYVELLADDDVPPETRGDFLEVINGQVDRLGRLIDNLLNLARIESGVVKVHKQSQSLNTLLNDTLDVVRPAAEAKQIELKSELSPMYLNALIDYDQLSQAAINLLSNAIKYTHPGGRVTLRSHMVDQNVQFEVEDTGVGLSPEDCQRIFEKFYRVNKDASMAPGTGLGLPLAKSIVEEIHGGRLSVQSEPGQGCTFTVTLSRADTLGPAGALREEPESNLRQFTTSDLTSP